MEIENKFITREMVLEGYRYQPVARFGEDFYTYCGDIGPNMSNERIAWLKRIESEPDIFINGVAIDIEASYKKRDYVYIPDILGKWWLFHGDIERFNAPLKEYKNV